MSYTNSTPNLHLPQYIATDKPTYLGDWNASMQTIDTVITSTQATANGASSTATSANSTALAAQNTANNALNKAGDNATSITEINNNLDSSTLDFSPITAAGMTDNSITANSNKYLAAIKITASWVNYNPNNITNKVVVGSITRIPIFTLTGNPFNLTVSNISDESPSSSISMRGGSYRYSTDSEQNVSSFASSYIIYDGANTIIYLAINNGVFNNIESNSTLRYWTSQCIIF